MAWTIKSAALRRKSKDKVNNLNSRELPEHRAQSSNGAFYYIKQPSARYSEQVLLYPQPITAKQSTSDATQVHIENCVFDA